MRNRGSITTNARKRRPKTRAKVSALRADPTRSLTLRRGMAVKVRSMFARLRMELYRLVVDEDELGLKDRLLTRNNCGIGADGFEAGNDCAAGGDGGGGLDSDTESAWSDYATGDMIKSVSRGQQLRAGDVDAYGTKMTDQDISSVKAAATKLQSKAESSNTGYRGVYRGMILPQGTNVKEHFKKGSTHEFDSLTAVATTDKLAMKYTDLEEFGGGEPGVRVVMRIERKGGVKGVTLGKGSEFGADSEAILPKGSKFKIARHDKRGDVHVVTLYDKGDLNEAPNSGSLKYNPPEALATNADAWRFNSDPEKLQKFQEWLRRQLQQFLVGRTQEELWRVYTEQGIRKGAARSFEDARGIEKLKDAGTALAFYAGTKEEFLRSSFRQPESVSKIQLLASRTFTDLKNVTEDMATRMSRTLVDGLTSGQGPRQIAVKLDADLDIGRTRALTIARTEIIRAHAEGQLLALEQLGVQEVGAMVEWSTAGDERVCPLCKPLEGVVLKIDEAKGMLPRHPNCRCAWIPANVGEDQRGSKTTKGQITKSVTKSQELEGKTSWGPGQAIAKKRPESILNAAARFNMALNNCGIGPEAVSYTHLTLPTICSV